MSEKSDKKKPKPESAKPEEEKMESPAAPEEPAEPKAKRASASAREGAEAAEAEAPENGGEGQKSGWSAGELEALRAENAELKDKLLRTVAEMENVRRRTERDKADTAKYAVSNFARDMLTIGDNLRRAIEHVPAEAVESDPNLKSFLDGVEVTERELLNMLERHGITRIDPKGERFDPNKHQAMFEIPDADVADGTVMEVIQAGYLIADRVLRPALVGVAKGGPKEPRAEPKPEPPKAANDDSPEGEPPDGKPGSKGVGGNIDTSA